MKKFDAFIDFENETHYLGLYAIKAWAKVKAKARGYDPAAVYYVERR